MVVPTLKVDWMASDPIQRMLRMYLKSRLLIGREPKILLSDWLRGLSENIYRGYTYDPESLPL